jgi:O-antigen ligase
MIQSLKGRITGSAELLLLLSVVACVLEGALRKWIFRESAGPIRYACYFAKDFIFTVILFCRPVGALNQELKRVLVLAFPLIIGGIIFGSVHDLNVVGGILSFRALVGLPIIAYFAIPRLREIKIDMLLLVIGGLTVLNAALGLAQNSSAPDAPINFYATSDLASATAFEENVRAAGTFSYITGYSTFATVGAWAGVCLLCLARGRILYIIAGWGFYAASLICALVSISRGTVLIVVAMLVVFTVSGKDALGNLFKGIVAAAVLFAIGYALSFNPLLVRLTDTVIARHEAADDTVEERTVDPFLDAGIAAQIAPLGAGFGTEQVAGVYAETGVMSLGHFESQYARIVMETGLIGLVGFLILCIGAVYVLFRTRRMITDEGLRRVFLLSAFLVGSLFFTNVVFNHFASYFAWMILALTLATASRGDEGAKLSSGPRSFAPALASD